ncbi:hypothetical protein BU26DRAFT_521926 [Trematosphaeria pertusa]|uniref:Uncharacterized protein n=1 Tax=Trematosphaeria pertusa TaxID=390896 RepID=A0A6A6I4P2_9PLEO|nr:uncharacterized protein BU26DRAFT_521926 [Trematosphaeria pertusa]KAF2245494.1 hypothetical protein BU26DRAFT_521926 [Trematosphaeria pertusa]
MPPSRLPFLTPLTSRRASAPSPQIQRSLPHHHPYHPHTRYVLWPPPSLVCILPNLPWSPHLDASRTCFGALALALRILAPCYCRRLRAPLHPPRNPLLPSTAGIALRCFGALPSFWSYLVLLLARRQVPGAIHHSEATVQLSLLPSYRAIQPPTAPSWAARQSLNAQSPQPPARSCRLCLFLPSWSCQALRDVVLNGEISGLPRTCFCTYWPSRLPGWREP